MRETTGHETLTSGPPLLASGEEREAVSPPPASEYGTCATVKARFWPWLSVRSPWPLVSCSLFARKRSHFQAVSFPSEASSEEAVSPPSASERRGNSFLKIACLTIAPEEMAELDTLLDRRDKTGNRTPKKTAPSNHF